MIDKPPGVVEVAAAQATLAIIPNLAAFCTNSTGLQELLARKRCGHAAEPFFNKTRPSITSNVSLTMRVISTSIKL